MTFGLPPVEFCISSKTWFKFQEDITILHCNLVIGPKNMEQFLQYLDTFSHVHLKF